MQIIMVRRASFTVTPWDPTMRAYVDGGTYRLASVTCTVEPEGRMGDDRVPGLITLPMITNLPDRQSALIPVDEWRNLCGQWLATWVLDGLMGLDFKPLTPPEIGTISHTMIGWPDRREHSVMHVIDCTMNGMETV